MSETLIDIELRQAQALLRAHAILRRLVEPESFRAGIAVDDRGSYCLYCSWQSLGYGAKPNHDTTCPILQGQMLLQFEGYNLSGT